MRTVIESENLCKYYGKVAALNKLSVSIEEGVCGMMGPNGAGKSTFIKILYFFIKKDSGNFTVLGSNDQMEIKRRSALIQDKSALPPELEVSYFLEKSAAVYNSSRRDVAIAMDVMGLNPVSRKAIGQLSRGFQRRVSIAQSLSHNPELIIADEPFAQLDYDVKTTLKDDILRVNKEIGTSFFITSHDLTDLGEVCDKVYVISSGRIKGEDPSNVVEEGLVIRTDSTEKAAGLLREKGLSVGVEGNSVIIRGRMRDIFSSLSELDLELTEVRKFSLEDRYRLEVAKNESDN